MLKIILALAGNPNAGKTTLFNALTGARQHVGNYPGVTVERKEGDYHKDDFNAVVVDLPGTYSLTAYSEEEVVARDFLANEKPAVVINILDAANLERNLYLTCQLLELKVPLVVALNMMDVAKDRGMEIDIDKLSAFLGVPVLPIVARSSRGLDDLMAAVKAQAAGRLAPPDPAKVRISYGDDIDQTLLTMTGLIRDSGLLKGKYPARWIAVKIVENDEMLINEVKAADPELGARLLHEAELVAEHLMQTFDTYPEAVIADHRYGFIKGILKRGIITHRYDENRLYTSDRIDKVLTNRFAGPLLMLAVLFSIYQITFSLSALPVSWVAAVFGWLGGVLDAGLTDGPLKSMLISGVIDGVGGVLGFVPLIMLMFLCIAILEDSGYLARVAFMMDRIFRIFGLHGSSVMAFIVSGGIAGGCAVPGVMAARTLRSPKERMATLLTVPFMNCGAKLPIMALLIGAFFAEHQAMYMFGFTLFSWVVALVAAKILRLTVLRGAPTPFVMELPPYRFPTFKGLLIHTWERTWQYIKKAGTVILAISILLWAMMTYPGLSPEKKAAFVQEKEQISARYKTGSEERERLLKEVEGRRGAAALQHSIAGRIGVALEKVTWLSGFDWRTNIALLGGFAAKEVVVSTLGTAYSMGDVDPEAAASLGQRLARDAAWSPLVALSALLFMAFYAPCFVTVVCIAREAGSWKWAFFSIGYSTTFAFILSTGVYQVGRFLGF
ncbi:MAG: ferrous iron transport protein B [Deltaproteobacteria bacterium]|nr:ferrous iron transport protein B [Deltaproteobacteria bacterium]